ncbi:MAG: polysaccharide deacetylase family protein [Pseudorhodoplanes sp.]
MSSVFSRYDYSSIAKRRLLRFPDGKRVAVLLYLNVQHFPPDRPEMVHALVPATASFQPDILNTTWRDYGMRVGIWRLAEMLDRQQVRATALLNREVCAEYPDVIEEGNRQKWEWLASAHHGSSYLSGLSEEDEKRLIEEVVSGIERGTGLRPRGWLTPCFSESFLTPDLLAESGIQYLCDYTCDDQPFPLKVRSGSLLSIPYSLEINDIGAFLAIGVSGENFGRMIRDQFDVLYREGETRGRVLAICLHTFLMGQPFRAKHLEEALRYILGHEGVWMATAGELNDWYRSENAL